MIQHLCANKQPWVVSAISKSNGNLKQLNLTFQTHCVVFNDIYECTCLGQTQCLYIKAKDDQSLPVSARFSSFFAQPLELIDCIGHFPPFISTSVHFTANFVFVGLKNKESDPYCGTLPLYVCVHVVCVRVLKSCLKV